MGRARMDCEWTKSLAQMETMKTKGLAAARKTYALGIPSCFALSTWSVVNALRGLSKNPWQVWRVEQLSKGSFGPEAKSTGQSVCLLLSRHEPVNVSTMHSARIEIG